MSPDPSTTASTPVPEDLPSGVPSSWRPVFVDDFTGSKLDTGNWRASRYGDGTGDAPFNPQVEDAWFKRDNVTVADGALVLTLDREARRLNGKKYDYSSGVVQSAPGMQLRAGSYLEARIQVPTCDGCWPAFWAVPSNSWPPEVDIMEYFDTGRQTRPQFNYIEQSQSRTGPDSYGDPTVDYRNGWHVYGLLWTGSRLVPYLDGQPYPDVAATENLPTTPLSVILNLSVRDGGAPEVGAQMLVDWVRVWSAG